MLSESMGVLNESVSSYSYIGRYRNRHCYFNYEFRYFTTVIFSCILRFE